MTLITGTPIGTINTMEDLFITGAPNIYFQDYGAGELNTPDADGFYSGLSGTVAKPIYEMGCYSDVSLADSTELTSIRCDSVGDKSVLMKRNYLELKFTLKSLFPLATLTHILNGGAVTAGSGLEKMGLGVINNNVYWHVYFPKVYDEVTGDYVSITGHKCKFVGAFELNMPYADQWNITGVTLRLLADTTKPSAQQFATVIRADPVP
jgi:hypothetical protein